MLDYLKQENRFLPWKFVIDQIKKIFTYIEDDSQIYSKFRVCLNKILIFFLIFL